MIMTPSTKAGLYDQPVNEEFTVLSFRRNQFFIVKSIFVRRTQRATHYQEATSPASPI